MKAVWLTPVLAGLLAAGCGGSDSDQASAPATTTVPKTGATTTSAPAPKATGVEIQTAASDFGRILWGGQKRAIYLFDIEKDGKPACYGECAVAWPPVLTKGDPQANQGVKAGLLGTVQRKDGKTQATYAGHPLYYYVNDPSGEVYCQDEVEYGGRWLVVRPDGKPVT
jgi:predicted lipoprotein with Yx(FWY)xxD motif